MGTLVRLRRTFFNRPTLKVARELLGCILVVRHGRQLRRGLITETEAYVGPHDKASHASRGRTPRTELMFGEPGHLYVYLIYGMHYCVNVVTERVGYPAAVLIRAVVPLTGKSHATLGKLLQPAIIGPGRACRYFGIGKRHNSCDVATSTSVWFERGVPISPRSVVRSPRVGVDYAGAWKYKPWNFALVRKVKKS